MPKRESRLADPNPRANEMITPHHTNGVRGAEKEIATEEGWKDGYSASGSFVITATALCVFQGPCSLFRPPDPPFSLVQDGLHTLVLKVPLPFSHPGYHSITSSSRDKRRGRGDGSQVVALTVSHISRG